MLSAQALFFFFGASIALSLASPLIQPVDSRSLFKRLDSGCSATGQASCRNTSSVSNLCCFEAPGGLLLQTQFWDTAPSTGPSNSWTVHGLWPDNCDGTFESSCDPSRAYTDIPSILSNNGASETLDFMNEFWVDIRGQNMQFWQHEWSKHGTCMSTLETECLPDGSPRGAEAAAYFQTVERLFKNLPTYEWLSAQGITPSSSKTYSLSALTSALKTASGGFTPALDCSSRVLNQISWYFNLKGSVIDGDFIPIDAPKAGSCPSNGIKYPPKTGSPTGTSPTDTTTTPTPTEPSGSLPTKATIRTSITGGLLSAGTWSTQTLATYTLSGTTSSFTMSTSKGACGLSGGRLTCGSGVSSVPFSAVVSGDGFLLASGGSTAFSSDGTPSGTTQLAVFADSSHSTEYTLTITAA